jgi:gliding motility-associated-like protein
MKKVTLFLLLLCFSLMFHAQVLNQSAAWPNTNWTVTGTYNADPDAFEADPTLTANFAFDDDDAGGASDDVIAAESPIIDLSAAFTAGETWLFLDADYTYNDLGDVLNLEYWDTDSSTWISWQQFDPSADQPNGDFCSGTRDSFTSNQLNIAGFSATQQSGFKYRIAFDDLGGWHWGFCFDAPIITSETPPSCPDVAVLTATNISANSADLQWTESGSATVWNIEVIPSGDTPTGTPSNAGVSNPYTVTGLMGLTSYDYYVQSDCGGSAGTSNFVGPFTFTTLCDAFVPDYIENFSTVIPDCWDEASNGDATTGPLDLGFGEWAADGFQNAGTTGAYRINLWNLGTSDWLITPNFDLTGGPFQVEFNFGIMQFGQSGPEDIRTLGSDDTVQLLITTDNGATWTALLTLDNTTVVPFAGITPTADLTAYSGQTVQFGILGSEGAIDDPEDNDVFVDNFRVRNIPTCPEPTVLTANNLSLTSTEIGWTEVGTATSWNIEYGISGFTPGTGIIEAGITTNPFVLTGLDSDSSYEFYVQAICDATNLSSFAGPSGFFTGYCESIPTTIDGTGAENVTIGITDFPSLGAVPYENQTSPVVNVFRAITTDFEITYGHGFTYNTNVWVDFNDNLEFEETELIFQENSSGAGNPHSLSGSFTIPATAPIGAHRMRVGGADFGQATPNPCFNGTFGVTLDFTVNVQELTCTLPEAVFAINTDCDNNQFFIDVNVGSLGDAMSLEISNDVNTDITQVTEPNTFQVGPFPFPTAVKIFVTNEQDNNCTISSNTFEVLACPPDNDSPCDATVAIVNDSFLCVESTPGTLLAATDSGVPTGSCGGNPDDDVWFQFVAQDEFQLISIANFPDFENIDHALYSGSCDGLVELSCSAFEYSSVTPALTIGDTYFVRVFSGGSTPESITFDLCITPYVAPINVACDLAENYCSGNDASDILYSYNTIGVLPGEGQIDCLFTTPNPTYSVLQIGNSGDILIEMVQNTAFDGDDNPIGDGLDVDFLLWGPYSADDDLCTLASVVDCSYSAEPVENVTLIGAQQDEIYLLLITNFARDGGLIQVRQTNTAADGSGSTIADIEAEITSTEVVFVDTDADPSTPVEANVCGFETVTIFADSPFADEYFWLKDGFEIIGETSASLTITESNNYQVLVTDNQCGSTALSQVVVVNLYDDAGSIAPQIFTVCDGAVADGSEDFNLDQFSTDLGLGEGFTVSYYTNTADANQAINAVPSTYNSSGETLIIRVEDTDAATNGFLGCRSLADLELTVNARPIVNQPVDFIVCDDLDGSVDGITEFDLASINDEINTDTDIIITYHGSQEDADASLNPLETTYSSAGETIYVRAEKTTTGCYETTTFNLEVNIVPLATFDPIYSYEVCPEATVPVEIGLIPTNFEPSEVTIQWFVDDALIPGQSGLILSSVLVQGEYRAEITFIDSGCTNDAIATPVIELETCVIPQGISPGVSIGFNDTFDLSSYDVTKLEIFNRNGTIVYSKANYTNEWVGQTNDGKELPVGTYFYTMEYEGGTKKRSAWIYINR